MATLYKRRDKDRAWRWYIQFTDPETGHRIRQAVSPDPNLAQDKVYAQKVLAELEYRIKHNKLKRLSGITLNEFVAEFLLKYAEPRKTPLSLELDHYIFKHLLNFFGPETLAESIGPAEMDNYVTDRKAKVKNVTVNRELNTIKRAFKWAARNKLLSQNRLLDYELLPREDTESRFFTPDKIATLMANTSQRFGLFMMLILYTGMRITKALNLRWREINFEIGFIRIVSPKTRRQVMIPMSGDIHKLLIGYQTKISPQEDDLLFPWTYTAVRQKFNRLRVKTNLTGYTLNSLRHTFATYSSMTGKDQEATSKAMGHGSLRTTSIYTHFPLDRLKQATSGLNFLTQIPGDIFGDILNPSQNETN